MTFTIYKTSERDKEWEVEVTSINDILDLIDRYHSEIIVHSSERLEIYDTYRE